MGWLFGKDKTSMVSPENALPGRATRMAVPGRHEVLDAPPAPPYPEGSEIADFGLGCFWGAERIFWQTPGVVSTSVGYGGGYTQNPTYEEVCTGQTGHTELVRVVFDPARVSYEELLRVFWESHNPTQGMRQGNDVGTQYRSAIYLHSPEQEKAALASRDAYQKVLTDSGYGAITTEIAPAGDYFTRSGITSSISTRTPAVTAASAAPTSSWVTRPSGPPARRALSRRRNDPPGFACTARARFLSTSRAVCVVSSSSLCRSVAPARVGAPVQVFDGALGPVGHCRMSACGQLVEVAFHQGVIVGEVGLGGAFARSHEHVQVVLPAGTDLSDTVFADKVLHEPQFRRTIRF